MGIRLTSIAAYMELKDAGKLSTQRAQIIKILARRANMSLREIQKEMNKNKSRRR